MTSPNKKQIKQNFPWKSKSALNIKRIFHLDLDYKCMLEGADQLERQLLVEALIDDAPFDVLNIVGLDSTSFEKILFGYYSYTATEQKISRPGIANTIQNGALLIESTDQMEPSLQLLLPSVLDSKIGRCRGPYEYENVPINFKMVFALDNSFPVGFEDRLFYRLGHRHKLSSLSERPEDLVSVLTHALKKINMPGSFLDISEDFCEHLASRAWPFDLGQWIQLIAVSSNACGLTNLNWSGFISALPFDLEKLMGEYDKIKTKHNFKKRTFLLERISQASNLQSLFSEIGLSLPELLSELKKLGLEKDQNLTLKLLDLPVSEDV